MLNHLFLSAQYIPHGHCYLWQSRLVWLHISADFLIAIAYFSIPIALLYFVRQQQENPFEKILVLFSLFIFSCGTTHLISIWTLWHPDYWVSGTIKAVTALVSIYTAFELIRFFPFALSLPDPQDLKQVNQDLAGEIESRQKMESELEQERSFLKAVLNNLSVCVVACDERGNLTVFNQASQQIFGTLKPLPTQEWSQHYGLYELDGETLLKEADLPLFRAYGGETFTDAEFICMNEETGKARILLANGCPILDSQSKTLGAVVTATDVTKSRQTEQQLRNTNAELLLSNQELENFAYIASHDLREPLRMVTSFTQLLAQRYGGRLDDEADKIIGFAVDGAKRMEILIEDLLLYSRIGKDIKPLKLINCNLVWETVRANLRLLIRDTNAQIKVKPLPRIVGDESQLVQLLQNLVNNALIYRSQSDPIIEISAEAQKQGWLFSIKDNGIGIEARNSQRIFDIFQRLHPKEKYSGTGIGLAICKKIVERHGGNIWVESELGSGSIFRFTLNCRDFDSI